MPQPTGPWGIPWQAFWPVYGLWFVLAWVLVGLTRRRERPGMLPSPLPELGTEELAYLYGGAYRVAETVVARLLSQGKLRARRTSSDDSVILGRSRSTRGASALAAEAIGATNKKPQRPGDLLGMLQHEDEMSRIVGELRGYGLVSSARTRALRKWGPHGLLIAWVVLGVARFVTSFPKPATSVVQAAHTPSPVLLLEPVHRCLSAGP